MVILGHVNLKEFYEIVMKHHKAKKVVIITEKIISEKVAKIIDGCGATGHTICPAGGKGSRGVRSIDRDSMTDSFANVKIEVIVASDEMANKITDVVVEECFGNYSGITYVEDVEILRPQKF